MMSKKGVLKVTDWRVIFMLVLLVSVSGIVSHMTNVNVNLNLEVKAILERLEQQVNSTWYALQQPYSYVISAVQSGATTYYCMQNGTTGKLDYYSTNDDLVIQSAIDNTTTLGGSIMVKPATYSASVTLKNNVGLIIQRGATGITVSIVSGGNAYLEDYQNGLRTVWIGGVAHTTYLDDLPSTASYVIKTDGSYTWATKANGDIVYNNTNANSAMVIQYAIDNMPIPFGTTKSGKIFIKNGYYRIWNTINVTKADNEDNIVLEGEEKFFTRLNVMSTTVDILHLNGQNGEMTIRSLGFTTEVAIRTTYTGSFIGGSGAEWVTIEDCFFGGATSVGAIPAYAIKTGDGHRWMIRGNHIESMKYGFNINGAGSWLCDIYDNIFGLRQNGVGIKLYGSSGSAFKYANIHDNTFYGQTGETNMTGIQLTYVERSQIDDNNIFIGKYPIRLKTGASYNLISSNRIHHASGNGTRLESGANYNMLEGNMYTGGTVDIVDNGTGNKRRDNLGSDGNWIADV